MIFEQRETPFRQFLNKEAITISLTGLRASIQDKTKKFYFDEGKNPGSEDRAWSKCGRAVEKIGKAKYKNFISGKNEGYYNYWCNPSD